MKKRSASQRPLTRTTAKNEEKHPTAGLSAQPTAAETRRARLAALQQPLNVFRRDREQALRDLRGDYAQATQEALKKLVSKGHQAEVESYLNLIATAQKKNTPALAKEVFFRGHSLRAWCRYLEQGEATLFSDLPKLFLADDLFFQQEPWIQKIFAEWHRQGEIEKITTAYVGSRKNNRGRSFKLVMENRQRDEKIVPAVEQRLQAGHGYLEAMQEVSQTLDTLGIRDRLSPRAIRKIYEEWTKPDGVPSLVHFLVRL